MARRLAINKASLRKYNNLSVEGYGDLVDNLNNVLDKTEAENLKGVFMKAGRVGQESVKNAYEPHRKTGRLELSVFVAPGKPDKANVLVGVKFKSAPEGYWLEYGTVKQPATPLFRPAITAAKPEMSRIVVNGMREIIDRAGK